MQFALSVAALAATVSANVLQPRAPAGCGTQIQVSGGVSGTLGQLSDGQNRIGPYPPATYYFNAGGFTDQSNRGCILTPPTTQFQCDVGARPTTGFAIGSSGVITSSGSSTFYACPASNGVYNIYTRPVANQNKCLQVQLKAANARCYAAASSSSRFTNSTIPARPTTTPRPVSPTTSPRPVTTTSPRPVTPSTSPRPVVPATSPRPSTPATSPRAATSPVAVNTCPPAKTVTVTAAAAAPPARTVTVTAPAAPARTVTVCPSQAAAPAAAQSSARPAAAGSSTTARAAPVAPAAQSSARPAAAGSSTTVRAAGPATSTRTATSTATIVTSTARPQTPTTSPRPVTPPPTTPRPVTPISSSSVRYTNSTRPASTSTSARPASSCPALLTGNYRTPSLIVPVNSQSPARAYGTGYNGTVSPTITSDFNFDIPQSYAGKTCNLVFYFPTQAQLQTSSFTQSGNGGSLRFAQLSRVVGSSTTFQNQPPASRDLGVRTVAPGNAYTISTGACPAGQTVSYSLSSVGGYSLNYFQDYNPCPIGLFITSS